MCGIVGYIGKKPAQPLLLEGLKRMEYRGYDSAGITTLNGKFTTTKTKGKVSELKKLIKPDNTDKIGIGHTRWATHGEPSTINSHPHQSGKIILVHNGIIENYQEIKDKLSKKGVKFVSETDTETLAALIDDKYKDTKDLQQAVEQALPEVRGTFGIAVLCEDESTKLIAARRGSPLIIGTNKEDVYVASDATAIIGHAKDVLYIEDDEIAVIENGQVNVFDLEHKPLTKSAEQLDLELESIQKQGFDHFLIKEIMEQPESVKSTMSGHLLTDEGTTRLGGVKLDDREIRQIQRILTIGCGTAYYAGLLSKYLLEKITDIPVDVEVASEFRYRKPVLMGNTVGIIVSQSGETADTLAALKELKNKGFYTHGVVNSVGSSIAREVDGGTYLHVGPEISVASTKAFTSQVIAQLLFGVYIARKRTLPFNDGQEIVKALEKLPVEIENALKLNDSIKKQASKLKRFDHALYMGRDTLYPVAMEGALKLKEVSYIHAEGYPSGEMKHGPIALIDKDFLTVFLLGKGPMFEKSLTNLQEVKARSGPVLVVTDDAEYVKQDKSAIYVETSSKWTAPLVMNVALQLLAYHIAVARGTDVDQPRNLAKSVTVE